MEKDLSKIDMNKKLRNLRKKKNQVKFDCSSKSRFAISEIKKKNHRNRMKKNKTNKKLLQISEKSQ